MDLNHLTAYLCPQTPQALPRWQSGYAWLGGGTWLFSEPQPQLHTLVDLGAIGWDELEAKQAGLVIGATCRLSQLKSFSYPSDWTAVQGLQQAIRALASFKVHTSATLAGNLCLALPASPFAPLMVALAAEYQLLNPAGEVRAIAAQDFQTGARQTVLTPGELLRSVRIPAEFLSWRVSFQRIYVASAGIAIALIVAAHCPQTGQTRLVIGGSLSHPRLLLFSSLPNLAAIGPALDDQIAAAAYLNDFNASDRYRRQVTRVLSERGLRELGSE